MRWVKFPMVEITIDPSTRQIASVDYIKDVSINVDHVFMVAQVMIPGPMVGPQGQPIGKMVARLVTGSGSGVIVDCTPAKALDMVMGDQKPWGEFPKKEKAKSDLVIDVEPEPGPEQNIIKLPARLEKKDIPYGD